MTIEPNHQKTQQFWDNEADTFDNQPGHGLRDPIIRETWTNLLTQWLPPPSTSILDLGCGTGSLSLVLAELGYIVTGIDLSPQMIVQAKAKAAQAGQRINFELMDASQPDFSGKRFDSLVCRHLLWALPDPGAALQRWSSLLATDGRILLIEGYWHTGVGLPARQTVELVSSHFALVTVKNLSSTPKLWGSEVTDERYVVIADKVLIL